MNLVVDASVTIKWFVKESFSDIAMRLSQPSANLFAPDLLLAEVGNIGWRKIRLGEIDVRQAAEMLVQLRNGIIQFEAIDRLVERALEFAVLIDHPIYDAFYLACAEMHDATLITADERLYKVTRTSIVADRVQLLKTFAMNS